MLGASRSSLAALHEELGRRADAEGTNAFLELSEQLFGAAGALAASGDLRGVLTDSGLPEDRRVATVDALFASRLSGLALDVLRAAVRQRWSEPIDLADALESLGAQAAFLRAETEGVLDEVEDELYRVSRVTEGDPRLRRVLSDPWVPAQQRVAVVRDILGGRVQPITLSVIEHVVASPRARKIEAVVAAMARLASERHGEVFAEAHVARPLDAAQTERLAAALSQVYGRRARVAVVIDPEVLGGVRIHVGDEVIDGSVARRLDAARQRLAG